MKKLVFTGGHHTSALAVIDALNGGHPFSMNCQAGKEKSQTLYSAKSLTLGNCRPAQPSAVSRQLFFIGHRYSMHGQRIDSAEYCEVTGRGIPFYNLYAGKVYKTRNLLEWLRVPLGFFQALWILLKIRPSLIVSFGGYLAVPVVLAGWVLGIPSVTHEQTVVSGWANRVIAKFAKKIFISWPESAQFFPKDKVVLTGLPLRKEIVALAKEILRYRDTETLKQRTMEETSSVILSGAKNLFQVGDPSSRPVGTQDDGSIIPGEPCLGAPRNVSRVTHTVYITGGKQGSQIINRAVEGCLSKLLANFKIIHQCGALDLKKFLQVRAGLPEDLQVRYLVKDYFPQKEIVRVYKSADFVVGRAGAHTVYELAALGKPAILIPIPWVSHNEQQENAEILGRIGLAKVLPQGELDSGVLLKMCGEVGEHLESFCEAGKKARELVRLDAAERIVSGARSEELGSRS